MRIETAAAKNLPAQSSRSVVARAPDHVRRKINASRIAQGLDPVLSARDYARLDEARDAALAAAEAAELRRGPGVWINQGGRLVPAGTSTIRQAPRPAPAARIRRRVRVLMLAAYGDASAHDVRGTMPECIARDAFGPAAELNASRGWTLRAGHEGHLLQASGDRLRAHDSPVGTILEWWPDLTHPWALEAVRAIEAGDNAVSVGMLIDERRTIRAPRPMALVTRARLLHVALLRGTVRPSYAGARSRVFGMVDFDDDTLLRQHIDQVIERGRFYDRKARYG
jgi:hypothetical protein